MNSIPKVLTCVVSAGIAIALFSFTAAAQTLPAESQSVSEKPVPAPELLDIVAVNNINITSQDEDGTIRAEVTVKNETGNTMRDLHLQASVLELPPSNLEKNKLHFIRRVVLDRYFSPDEHRLDPGETRSIPLTYKPSVDLSGQYRLRVEAVNSRSYYLGSNFTDLYFSGEASPVALQETAISSGEEAVAPQSGLIVNPSQQINLSFSVNNSNAEEVKGTLTAIVRDFSLSGETVSTEYDANRSYPAGKETVDALVMKAPVTPSSYYISLYLADSQNKRLSTVAEYRLIVRGSSGRIQTASATPVSEDRLMVNALVTGPADGTFPDTYQLSISLVDGTQILSSETTPLNLLSAQREQEVSRTITIDRQHAATAVKLSLLDGEEVIDEFTISLAAKSPAPAETASPAATATQTDAKSTLPVILALAAVIVISAVSLVYLWIRKAKQSGNNAPGSLIALLISLGILLTPAVLWADGILYDYYEYGVGDPTFQNKVRVHMNSPRHGGTYNRTNVPVDLEYTWPHCANLPSDSTVEMVYTAGHQTLTKANEDSFPWTKLATASTHYDAWAPELPGCEYIKDHAHATYICHGYYTGVFGIFAADPGQSQATIRTILDARWGSDVGIARYYDWIFFNDPPQVDLKIQDPSTGTYVDDEIMILQNEPVNLKWTASNANGCTAVSSPTRQEWSGAKNPNGGAESVTGLPPRRAGRYLTLRCTGSDGTLVEDTVRVNVIAHTIVNLQIKPAEGADSAYADTASVTDGKSVEIKWVVNRAMSCDTPTSSPANSTWNQEVPFELNKRFTGSRIVGPLITRSSQYTYSLTCRNELEEITDTVTASVGAAPSPSTSPSPSPSTSASPSPSPSADIEPSPSSNFDDPGDIYEVD